MSDTLATIPMHLGIILDGNRRWAVQHGLPAIEGHRKGFVALQRIADHAYDMGIKNMSVYAFSTENWLRSKEEVTFLMKFMRQMLGAEIKKMHKKGVRFIWLGSEDKLEQKMITQLRDAETLTKDNNNGTFCLCFNYGGQAEIVAAATAAAKEGAITEQTLNSHLYGGADVLPVDFLIRTSGEKRISNFMLWRAAYSELYFTDVLWPDFSNKDLDDALSEFAKRQRRFGG